MAVSILLICGSCEKQHQNYRTSKPKRMKEKNLKLQLQKYCKFCNQRQPHNEKNIDKKKK